MSHGHHVVGRHHPRVRRRAAHYHHALLARHARGLPPHLLPGVTGRTRKPSRWRRVFVAGTLLFLITVTLGIVSTVISSVAAVGGTLHAYREINADLLNAVRDTSTRRRGRPSLASTRGPQRTCTANSATAECTHVSSMSTLPACRGEA